MQIMDEVSNIFILSSYLIQKFLNREPGQKCGFLQTDLSFLIERDRDRNPLSYHPVIYCGFLFEFRIGNIGKKEKFILGQVIEEFLVIQNRFDLFYGKRGFCLTER